MEAEGLFRAALSRTSQCAPTASAGGPATEECFATRVNVLHDYALLLDKLEWNGKSRGPEGALLRAEIAKISSQRQTLKPNTAGDVYLERWVLNKMSL